MSEKREHWSGNMGFILAAAGSAVGLGNIWKFPYIAGQNGGGAFVLIYLACIFVIGLPVMLCAVSLGRHTQQNPVGAFNAVKPESSALAHIFGASIVVSGLSLFTFGNWQAALLLIILGMLIFKYNWTLVGIMGVCAGFIILSFYSVVAGWTIGYIYKAISGGLNFQNAQEASTAFSSFVANDTIEIACHFIFMVFCVGVVIKGVKKGIERWSKILMPILFLLLVGLILRGLSLEGSNAGVAFYLSPDFSKLNADSILMALGHAFFSLSLGMGVMITYGSYMSKKDNLFMASLSVVGLDTLVALMAGLAIFPAVFAKGFDPSGGPGLVFQVLPQVFSSMPGAIFWNLIFFTLLLVAALTSGISLLEVVSSAFIDQLKLSRKVAVLISGSIIFVIGCICATNGAFFDALDNLSSNWMLPLGGLFIAIFVGWIWGSRKAVEEIRHGSHNFADVHVVSLLAGLKDDPSHNSEVHTLTLASIWGIFIRFFSPVAIMIAFLHTIGWIKFD